MKIAFLDSGVGGMTVLEAFYGKSSVGVSATDEIIYLADLAHLPYGEKSIDELQSILLSNLGWLNGKVDIVVLACNTSSALLTDETKQLFPSLRIFSLLEAMAADLQKSQTSLQKIAVFSTDATHRSGAYKRYINSVLPEAEVASIPCPKLVPFIEANIAAGEETLNDLALPLVQEYVACLPFEPQAMIFGCTHYPLLKRCFQKLLPNCLLLDPAESIVKNLSETVFSSTETNLKAYATAYTDSLKDKIVSLKEIFGCAKYFASEVGLAQTASITVAS